MAAFELWLQDKQSPGPWMDGWHRVEEIIVDQALTFVLEDGRKIPQESTFLVRYADGHVLIARRPEPNAPIYTGPGDDEVGKALTRKADGDG